MSAVFLNTALRPVITCNKHVKSLALIYPSVIFCINKTSTRGTLLIVCASHYQYLFCDKQQHVKGTVCASKLTD